MVKKKSEMVNIFEPEIRPEVPIKIQMLRALFRVNYIPVMDHITICNYGGYD